MVRQTNEAAWPRIAVVGAGAVGAYFGARLARAGAPVVLIGRKPFVDTVQRDGLSIDSQGDSLTLRVEASTDPSACQDAQLVLFCVKTVDTVATARALATQLAPDAVLVTLQNGVESAQQVRTLIAGCEAIPAVVYVAVAVQAPGRVRHFGRGDLVLGSDRTSRQVALVCERAGIACRITDNIAGELWTKLLMNCALNALSALGRSQYQRIVECPSAYALMQRVVGELMDVAAATGVQLPALPDSAAAMQAVVRLVAQMPAQYSSMAQDLARGRRTEIDALNGYVQRRADELGLQAPANQALCALMKLAESSGPAALRPE